MLLYSALDSGAESLEREQAYIARFAYGAITSADFRAAFEDFFDPQRTGSVTAAAAAGGAAAATTTRIEWDTWLHAPGMPPVDLSLGCVLMRAECCSTHA